MSPLGILTRRVWLVFAEKHWKWDLILSWKKIKDKKKRHPRAPAMKWVSKSLYLISDFYLRCGSKFTSEFWSLREKNGIRCSVTMLIGWVWARMSMPSISKIQGHQKVEFKSHSRVKTIWDFPWKSSWQIPGQVCTVHAPEQILRTL